MKIKNKIDSYIENSYAIFFLLIKKDNIIIKKNEILIIKNYTLKWKKKDIVNKYKNELEELIKKVKFSKD